MKSDKDKILANRDKVMKIVSTFKETRCGSITTMLESDVGDSYFTAPASSRTAFHSCYPGGLVEHSLGVVRNAIKMAEALAPGRWAQETLAFCGLFHDFGKVGDGVQEYYVPTVMNWKKDKGEYYDINQKCIAMPTSERGLYIMQLWGVTVSSDEYLAIRLNDGQYVDENKYYKMKEPDLALIIHWADMWSTKQEK